MSVEVRELKYEDIEELTELWYELATMHQDIMQGYELSEEPRKEWKSIIEDGLEKKGMVTLVAEEKGKIVGFVNAVHRKRPAFFVRKEVGYILDLFVKEDRRNEGIGKKLVKRAERWIKDRGLKTAILTVSPENHTAVKFWEDQGYETYLLKKRKEL